MIIRITKRTGHKILLSLLFAVAASSIGVRYKYLAMLGGFAWYTFCFDKRRKRPRDPVFVRTILGLFSFFAVLLLLKLTLQSSARFGLVTALNYVLILCFASVACVLVEPTFGDVFAWTEAGAYFVTGYCLYCIYFEVIRGWSSGRSSAALGYASKNYMAAIAYMFLPLLFFALQNCKRGDRWKYYLPIGLSMLLVFVSGSRTSFGAVLVVVGFLFLQPRMERKMMMRVYVCLAVGLAVLIWLFLTNSVVQSILSRILTLFEGVNTASRGVLRHLAVSYYLSVSAFERLLGTGRPEFPLKWGIWRLPHNFWLELLLGVGAVGAAVYTVELLMLVLDAVKKARRRDRVYIYQAVTAFLITAMFQPFFSTSILCGFAFLLTVRLIARYHEVPERGLNKGGKR